MILMISSRFRREGDFKRGTCGAPASIVGVLSLGNFAKNESLLVCCFDRIGALSGFTANEDLGSSLPLAIEKNQIAKKEATCDERSALAFAPSWHSFSA
jgi:hypothetical protein